MKNYQVLRSCCHLLWREEINRRWHLLIQCNLWGCVICLGCTYFFSAGNIHHITSISVNKQKEKITKPNISICNGLYNFYILINVVTAMVSAAISPMHGWPVFLKQSHYPWTWKADSAAKGSYCPVVLHLLSVKRELVSIDAKIPHLGYKTPGLAFWSPRTSFWESDLINHKIISVLPFPVHCMTTRQKGCWIGWPTLYISLSSDCYYMSDLHNRRGSF